MPILFFLKRKASMHKILFMMKCHAGQQNAFVCYCWVCQVTQRRAQFSIFQQSNHFTHNTESAHLSQEVFITRAHLHLPTQRFCATPTQGTRGTSLMPNTPNPHVYAADKTCPKGAPAFSYGSLLKKATLWFDTKRICRVTSTKIFIHLLFSPESYS